MKTGRASSLTCVPTLTCLLALACGVPVAQAQSPGAPAESVRITVDNGVASRALALDSLGRWTTTSLALAGDETVFVRAGKREFEFLADGTAIDGESGWVVLEEISREEGRRARVVLRGVGRANAGLDVALEYFAPPGLPVVGKTLAVVNRRADTLRLEAVTPEVLGLAMGHTHAVTLGDYARAPHLGPYVGDWDDCLVVVHDQEAGFGLALGNEAPGVLKRTAAFAADYDATVGLTHPDQDYPFRRYLAPGDTFAAPGTFVGLYADRDGPQDSSANTSPATSGATVTCASTPCLTAPPSSGTRGAPSRTPSTRSS